MHMIDSYEDPAPDEYDGDKLRKCRLCGGDAIVHISPFDWEKHSLNCLNIVCMNCESVDVWAFKRETENGTYDETLRLAQRRWNDLMEVPHVPEKDRR